MGVTSRISLGVGVVAFPHRNVAGLLFVEPKVTLVDRPGLALSLGATGRIDLFRDDESTAVPYLVLTTGTERVSGTFGLGARVDVERPPSLVWYDDVLYTPPLLDEPLGVDRPARQAHLVRLPVGFAGLEAHASRRVTVIVEAALMPDQDLRFPTGLICDPGPCLPGQDYDVPYELGPLHHDLAVGAAARVATGRAAFDLGLLWLQDADAYAPSVRGLARGSPWPSDSASKGSGPGVEIFQARSAFRHRRRR